jgi:hypothetical protein
MTRRLFKHCVFQEEVRNKPPKQQVFELQLGNTTCLYGRFRCFPIPAVHPAHDGYCAGDQAMASQQLSPPMIRHHTYTKCPANLTLCLPQGGKITSFGQLG